MFGLAELHFCKIGFHVSDNLRRKTCECLSLWISFDGYFSGKSHVNSDYMPASIQAFVFRLFSSQFSHTHEVPGKNRWGKNFLKQSFCILTKLLMENGREGSWTGAIYILLIVCQFPPKKRKIVDNCLLACNEMRLREIPGREPNFCLAAKVI